jgi:hypothetical protein
LDITDALAPKSDQLDAIELVAPRTFTIDSGSRLGKRQGQPVVEIRLVGFPRVWRPSKGMLDAIVAVWGTNAAEWAGQSVTLYNDREVTFGDDKVGGVRISAMSGIDKPRTVQIRGRGQGARKIPWQVQPIATAPATPDPADYVDAITAAATIDVLKAAWQAAADVGIGQHPDVLAATNQRKAELAEGANDA